VRVGLGERLGVGVDADVLGTTVELGGIGAGTVELGAVVLGTA
jgi:hypothetical protein